MAGPNPTAPNLPTPARPSDRPDRLIEFRGPRSEPALAEFSPDGTTWRPATVYPGASVDEWRTTARETWDRSATEGRLEPGEGAFVWNYVYDGRPPSGPAGFRLRSGIDGRVLRRYEVDLAGDGFVLDAGNAARLAGGRLTEPWSAEACGPGSEGPLLRGEVISTPYASEYPTSRVENARLPPLSLDPGLRGWHRVYLGMASSSSVRFSLSDDPAFVPIPGVSDPRHRREYFVGCRDLTGRKVLLAPGGTPLWGDARIRYLRFVPMAATEVEAFLRRREAAERGRPFAGYVEPISAAYYNGETISLREYARNEMRLHRERGCTEVLVHIIRIGFSAWYPSRVVEPHQPSGAEVEARDPAHLKWNEWTSQGDPLRILVQEARSAGLGVRADLGMNITYLGTDRFHYAAHTGRFAREHPEYACPDRPIFFDYRHPEVQDYAVSIARELMTDYDLDGLHLDFARFAYRKAFDEASLVRVLEAVDADRRKAEGMRGHPLGISVRIPSYLYHVWPDYTGEYPEFVAALRTWARHGWIDRAMACCMLSNRLHEVSLERYADAVAGTGVELWGDLYGMPHDAPRDYYLRVARKWRAEGLDGGFFFYQAAWPIEFFETGRDLRRIDHPEFGIPGRGEAPLADPAGHSGTRAGNQPGADTREAR